MKIETIKNEISKVILVIAKIVFKAGLVVTGISTYSLGWIDTPYGTYPILQIFGTLNIVAAIGWEYATHKIPTTKKSK